MKIKFLYLFLASLLMITSCRNTDDFEEENNTPPKSKLISQNYNLRNWMSQIPDNVYLSKMSIPGTHDSGAMYEWKKIISISGSAKAQTLTIKEQLEAGVRYLDIRANHEMKIYHGSVDQKLNLEEVLNAVRTFLSQNPSETIIMSLKPENTNKLSEFNNNFRIQYNKFYNLFKTGYMLPTTIGTARGKVILIKRFDSPEFGITATNWKDNTTFSMSADFPEFPPSSGNKGWVHIQDFYNPSSSKPGPATDAKKTQVLNLINQSRYNSAQWDFYINYLSVAMTGTGIIPLLGDRDIINTKKIMNPWMVERCKTLGTVKLGIVAFDYITETESRAIINTN